MIEAYKIIFLDGSERPYEVFEQIDFVKANRLVDFVRGMIRDGRICEESLEEYYDKYSCIQTEQNAEELLKMDGYTVEKVLLD